MGQKKYLLGSSVQLSLTATDDSSVTLIAEYHDDENQQFCLDLTNFTGKLQISSANVDIPLFPVQTINEETRTRTDNNETTWVDDDEDSTSPAAPADESAFSLALGEPQDVLAELALESEPQGREILPETSVPSNIGDYQDSSKVFSECSEASPNVPSESVLGDDASVAAEETKEEAESDNAKTESTITTTASAPPRKKGIALFQDVTKKVIDSNQFRLPPKDPNEDSQTGSKNLSKKLANNWGNLLFVTAVRNKLPSRIREKRSMAKREADARVTPPTVLHELCARSSITLPQLQTALEQNPDAVSVKDDLGRLPLHILGDNDQLVSQPAGKQIATSFGWHLMRAYPEAVTTRDEHGLMPFVSLIEDWFFYVYESHRESKRQQKENQTVTQGKNLFNNALGVATGNNRTSRVVSGTGGDHSNRSTQRAPSSGNSKDLSSAPTPERRAEIATYSTRANPSVSLWEEVEWSFNMLSMAMDELGGKNGGLHKPRARALVHHHVKDRRARTALATHVVTIMPTILKTVLLLEEDGADARKRLLKMSLFRRILLCPESVGPWLTNMLRRKGLSCVRAVDYLEMVSETTVDDYIGEYRTALTGDEQGFLDERTRVFEEVGNLEGLIASLVVLEQRETERAAATSVVWNLMGKNLKRPFVVGLVIIDFVLHITLMLAYRVEVSYQGFSNVNAIGNVPTQVVIFISCHYFLRKWCEAFSLLKLSPKVFRSYFTNIWTLFDFVSIILVLTSVIWNQNHANQYRQGLNTFVLGLLWIKVLGFLKVVNKEMSTFILSLIQILRDLRYFLLVLAVVFFMFGDMMHIALSTKDNGQFCLQDPSNLSDPEKDFCSEKVVNSYLRVYALLLGDFNLSDYTETTGILVLFIMFTMIGVIILLNVLIAVVSDSYERAKIESIHLFGRARVTFVAQNEALETFLRPGTNPLEGLKFFDTNRTKVWVVGTRIFRHVVLFAIIATAMDAEIYLLTRSYTLIKQRNFSIFQMCLNLMLSVLLTLALWVVLSFAIEGMIRRHLSGVLLKAFKAADRCSTYCVNWLALQLFGLKDGKLTFGQHAEEEEEWAGRIVHMERMLQRTMDETKDDLTAEIKALEKRLYEHEFLLNNSKIENKKPRSESPSNI